MMSEKILVVGGGPGGYVPRSAQRSWVRK